MLDRLLRETDQRQKATDLVLGTMRNRGAIDAVIAMFSGRIVERIQEELLSIVRIGIYELIYCPAAEEYAIVNEAVENAKANVGQKQAGFVNAVLRQIVRHISYRENPLSRANIRRILVQAASSGCEFDTDFLPDRTTCPVDYLSTVFSLPQWLVADWFDAFGEESAWRICLASNRKPSITLRPNPLRTATAGLVGKLRQADIEVEIIPIVTPAKAGVQKCEDIELDESMDSCLHRNDNRHESMIRIKSPRAISQLPGFVEGEFMVQDIAASQPVRRLNPQPDWTILDLCAAPGVKTIQLAEATGDSGKIIATDINQRRLVKVKENIARLGIKSVEVVGYEELGDLKVDCVLLDVPCSNTGVLARRIEARYRIRPRTVQAHTKIQGELLEAAATRIKPHGKICYSTCSIQKAENGDLVREFIKKNHDFELESEELILPSAEYFDHDGGYTAILVRK
jgi:16S rRNA (cytosine967-C5)-methyltransferase